MLRRCVWGDAWLHVEAARSARELKMRKERIRTRIEEWGWERNLGMEAERKK